MKFYTKDFYNDGFSDYINDFIADDRASTFSNALFEELINEKIGIYNPFANKKKQLEYLLNMRTEFSHILFQYPSFIERLMSAEEIVKVPDIRILSMGIAAPETAAILNNRIRALRQGRKDAERQYKEYLDNNPKANKCYKLFSRRWCLHDYLVVDCVENDGIIELKLRPDKKIKTSLILSDAHIIMQESAPVDKYIFDTEIYYEDNTYTICFLIADKYNNLFYFDISAKAIEFR